MKKWYMQKTLWAGAAIMLTGFAQIAQGGDITGGITTVITGIAVITGRQAIEGVKGSGK
jgi:hypothetical protein